MSLATQRQRPLMLISVEGTGNNQLEPGQKSMGDAAHCSLLRHPLPKPTGVLEHCREGETNCWISIFRSASFNLKKAIARNCTLLLGCFYLFVHVVF